MKTPKHTTHLTALLAALQLTTAHADTLLRWDFLNDSPNGAAGTSASDFTAPNMAAATLSRGARAGADEVYVSKGRGAFSTNSGDHYADLASALANGSYFQVTIAPQAGSTLSLSGMDVVTFTQNGNADFTFQLVFSTDGFATHTSVGVINPISANFDGALTNLDLSGFAALQNTASSIEFRAAYFGATSVGYQSRGLGQIVGANDDLVFYGSVASSAPLTITTSTLPNGTNGVSYSQNLGATGGSAPFTWTISSGSLPDGLNLTAQGVVEGTPVTNGTSNFTVQVADGSANTDTQALSITISAPPPPTITTISVPNTTIGANYSEALSNTNGTGPFTWSLTSGSLPAGLILTEGGVIEGTPSTTGSSTFTVTVTDSATPVAGTDSQILTIVVSETLVAWDFSNDTDINGGDETAVPDALSPNLQSPLLSRGASFGQGDVTFNVGRGAFATTTGFGGGDLSAALAQGAYASVTLAPQSGFKFSLSSVDLATFTQNSDQPNFTFEVAFSTDGFATYTSAGVINPVSNTWNGATRSINLSAFPELQEVTGSTTVEFRIAIYGGAQFQQRGFGQIPGTNNDIAFNGSTASTGFGSNYAGWAAANGVTGGKFGDSDNDGIVNLVEYALQTNLNGSNGSLGTFNGTTLSFAKRAVAVTNGDVSYAIETSPTLGAAPSPWVPAVATVNDDFTISYAFPAGPPVAFSRLKITSP